MYLALGPFIFQHNMLQKVIKLLQYLYRNLAFENRQCDKGLKRKKKRKSRRQLDLNFSHNFFVWSCFQACGGWVSWSLQWHLLRSANEKFEQKKLKAEKITNFQPSLFLRIITLLTWLESTLLLKIKCFDTTICMKTQCLQTNEMQHYSRMERCLRSGVGKRKGSINSKFNYAR